MTDPLRLLLLEDDLDDAALNQRALSKGGIVFTALRVDSEAAFVAALADFRPDIILADYHLPSFSGVEALALALAKSPDTPFILVSGVMGEEVAVDAIKRGATDYVLKDRLARLPIAVRRAAEEAELRAQRREAEKTQREIENRYRLLVENSPACIHEIDLSGRIISMNRAGLGMLGVDAESAVCGRSYLEAVAEADRARIATLFAKAYAGETCHFEFTPNGPGERIFQSSFAPIKNENGAVSHLMGITEDITERKQAEAELRIAATAFEAQEGMVITDADSVILRINRAFTEITGYTAAEAVGQKPRQLKSGRHDAAFYAAMWQSIAETGSWHGEIWNRRKSGEVFPEWLTITAVKESGGNVTHYVGTLTDITLRKSAEEEIRHLAFFDPLTNLPNRRLLLDRLQKAVASSARSGRLGALLFIDLDNFKTLNDTLGHDVGDLLLKQVALRLAGGMREGDTVARLGGDEFIVMLEDLSGTPQDAATQVTAVGEKALATLNQPYLLAGNEHHSTPSIGITLFGEQRETVDELLKRADLAMYQAKAAGRNTLRFYDPQMQAAVSERAEIEVDLHHALQQNEFLLYYQPQVDELGRITGAEALVRWLHPRRGLLFPAEFICLAEETGLILPLGLWVLETGCAQLVAWATRPDTAHLTLAVNVSARQFHRPDFVEQVLAVLDHSGANPNKLKLELTESLLLEDVEDIIAKMTTLKEHGVGFSLDDFGTGYSSLSYLKRLPLDQMKIDRSFVHDILTDGNDAAIARTIVALAQNMGMDVIAEGVETTAQRDLLAHQDCHAYQGYLFGKPVPVEQFDSWLRTGALT